MTGVESLLGIEIPVVQAPIGNASTVELVAAVGDAGGLGMFAGTWHTPSRLRALIRDTRARTGRPFGVNLVLVWPDLVEQALAVCIEEQVPVVSTFWGDPAPFVERLRGTGITTVHTVGSAEEARRAEDLGIDVVVAQGSEAGGHVWGRTSTTALVPAVADAVEVPVLAAGGIADGRGIAAALALGAAGVWMGTRFVATEESGAHPRYKQALVGARETGTVRGRVFDRGWPEADHRTLRNATVDRALSADEKPGTAEVLGADSAGARVLRYDAAEPLAGWTGRIDEMCLYAGQGCGLIHDIPPAGELLTRLWADAGAALAVVRAAL